MPKHKFIMSGGGTGGHIFPAIAIADSLKKKTDAEILFVGAKDRMEMQRVPKAGYPIEGLWISGIQRKLTMDNLSFPFKLASSLFKSYRLLKKFKPEAVVGTGGFASGPLLQMASMLGIPCIIQEQNSYAGITNKLLASKASKICVAYDQMEKFFPKDKIIKTGNPIREQIKNMTSNKEGGLAHFKLDSTKPTLLILGGSLGARKINQLISESLSDLLDQGWNIIWQTGKLYIDNILKEHEAKIGNSLYINAFIHEMNLAYSAADLVISRAGAGTLSELAVAKKASILIPSPNVAEDHQTKNAQALVKKDAALMFKENRSAKELSDLILQYKLHNSRIELEKNIAEMAQPNADDQIADEVLKLISNG